MPTTNHESKVGVAELSHAQYKISSRHNSKQLLEVYFKFPPFSMQNVPLSTTALGAEIIEPQVTTYAYAATRTPAARADCVSDMNWRATRPECTAFDPFRWRTKKGK